MEFDPSTGEQYPDELLDLFMDDVLEFATTEIPKDGELFEWDAYLQKLATDEAAFPPEETKNRKKHSRDSPIHEISANDSNGLDLDDDEQIKSRRLGSLGRIIANTAMVVERTESGSKLPSNVDDLALAKQRKSLLSQFLVAFNLGNMIGLADLIQEHCSETCELITPDLMEPIHGRAAIMMLFSLYFENFPDGIYKELPTASDAPPQSGNIVNTRYTFTGTCVLGQSIQLLYDQVSEHWNNVQATARIEEATLIDNIVGNNWIPNSKSQSGNASNSSSSSSGGHVGEYIPISAAYEDNLSKGRQLQRAGSFSNKSGPSPSSTTFRPQTNSEGHGLFVSGGYGTSIASASVPSVDDDMTVDNSSQFISLPPSSSFQPLHTTLPSTASSGQLIADMHPGGGGHSVTSQRNPSPRNPSPSLTTTGSGSGSGLWSLSPPLATRKSLTRNEIPNSSSSAAVVVNVPLPPGIVNPLLHPSIPPVPQFSRTPSGSTPIVSKPASSQPTATPWLMKTLQSLSTSFGKVAGKMATSLSLRERQTKHKRVMEFDFSDVVDNNNFISRIVISPYSKS